MVTARNVLSADGRLLLAEGQIITEAYIRRLQELGIYAIYVRNPYFRDVEIPAIIAEETRQSGIQTMKCALDVLRNKRMDLAVTDIQQSARRIVAEIIRNRKAMIHLTEIRTHDDCTFAHSVDVCILAVLVAVEMGYAENRLTELAVGALLHDVGKVRVGQQLLIKPDRLTDEEMVIMKGHPWFGFEILRAHKGQLSIPSIHVALQHHEKFDGTGYPRGLAGMAIHEFSRIVSIVDVYDAITSDRPYRKALLPHEAYELLQMTGTQHFDPTILPIFLGKIAVYPVGATVRLNTGDIGIVTCVEPGLPTRPVIRLILDQHRRLYPGGSTLDMRNHLTVFIDQVVDGTLLSNLI
jgi:HD-GYP domain-containing protein (c-di-GMP phosphodiesterase class II)